MNQLKGVRRKVLLIRFSSLGDIILTTPLVEALSRQVSPDEIEISYLTSSEFSVVLNHDSRIHSVIAFDRKRSGLGDLFRLSMHLSKQGFDTVYDLHGSLRSRLICFLLALNSIKVIRYEKQRNKLWSYFLLKSKLPKKSRPKPIWRRNLQLAATSLVFTPRLDFGKSKWFRQSESERSSASESKRQLIIGPSSKWTGKEWPAEGFLECAKVAISRGFRIAIIGLQDESNVVQLKMKCSLEGIPFDDWVSSSSPESGKPANPKTLEDLASKLIHAHGVVCNDSGLMHFAEALAVPVFSVFGPTKPDQGFGPFREDSVAVSSQLWCSPCSKDGSACFRIGKSRFSCIKNLKLDAFHSQYSQWLKKIDSHVVNSGNG